MTPGLRRVAVVGIGLAVGLGVLLGPGVAHADCTSPELPVVGCVLPAPSPPPSPEPSPEPSPDPTPTAARSTPTEAAGPPAAPQPGLTRAPFVALPAVALLPAPVPDVAPAPVVQPVVSARVAPVQPVALAASPLPGTLASSFALVVFGLLALPLLLGFLAGLRPLTASAAPHAPSPGGTMNATRTRLWTGMGVLALAAVVGGVGWYRISGEPLLNRQIPFLASAGILVVLLSVLGGALIVAEQLRGDQHRLHELEDAVRALTDALSPVIEQPARRPELGSDVLQS